jgi:hypothetical protein
VQHKVQYNVAKCQNLSKPDLSEDDFTLMNDVIPVVDKAKYLGVPFSSAGADWRSMSETQVKSAEGMLRRYYAIGSHWPHWIRLQLVQTFLLPKLDYCAAIGHGASALDSELREANHSMFKEFDEKVLSFVMNRGNIRHRQTCMRMMTMIKPTAVRHKDLFIGLYRHIQTLNIQHPIRSMQCSNDQLLLLSMIKTPSPEYDDWKQEMNARPRATGVIQLSDWLKKRFVNSILNKKDLLPLYILPCHTRARPDPALYHQDNDERQLMVKWRLGTMFVRHKCRCGEPFRRSHLQQCFYPRYRPNHPDAYEAELRWKLEEQKIRRLANGTGANYQGHYTVLDSYLNNSKAHLFMSLVKAMENDISP